MPDLNAIVTTPASGGGGLLSALALAPVRTPNVNRQDQDAAVEYRVRSKADLLAPPAISTVNARIGLEASSANWKRRADLVDIVRICFDHR